MLFNRLKKLHLHGKRQNQFTQKSVLSVEIPTEWKIEFLATFREKIPSQCKGQTAKCFLTSAIKASS